MKEASGELNLTVIVVIIIALLSFVFFSVIWPSISENFRANTNCNKAVCGVNSAGSKVYPTNGLIECWYKDKSGREHTITCPWKG